MNKNKFDISKWRPMITKKMERDSDTEVKDFDWF